MEHRDIANLSNKHLGLRIRSLENLSSQLHEEEIKPSLVRKVSREIVYSITSQHYHEKSWVDSLWKMLNQLLILQLPFPIEPYLLDVVSERMTISNDSIQLSLSLQVVLKILRSKEYIVEWITPGLTLIGQHFEKMMSCPPKILSKAVVDVVYYLKSFPMVLDLASSLWCTTSSFSLPAVALVLTNDSLPSQSLAEQYLQTYVQNLLTGSSKHPSFDILKSLVPFLNRVSQIDWQTVYSPALGRLMKKSPETSASIVSLLCCNVAVDCSEFVESSFIAPIVRMLKSTNSGTRDFALSAVSSVVRKCSTSSPVYALLSTLIDSLANKVPGSALTQEYQKNSILVAISDCAPALYQYHSRDVTSMNDHFVHLLLLCVEKESDDNTKCLIASAAASLAKSQDMLSTAILDLCATGVERRKTAFLLFLLMLLEPPHKGDLIQICQSIVSHSSLLSQFGSIVKEAPKKSGVNLDAALTFGILAELHSVLPLTSSIIEFPKIISLLGNFSSDSFLWNGPLRQYLFVNQQSVSAGLQLLSSYGVISIAISLDLIGRLRLQESKSLSEGEIKALFFCAFFPSNYVYERVKPHLISISRSLHITLSILTQMLQTLVEASEDREKRELDMKLHFKSVSLDEIPGNPKDQLHYADCAPSRIRNVITIFLTHSPTPLVISKLIFLASHPIISRSFSHSESTLKFFLKNMHLTLEDAGLLLNDQSIQSDDCMQLMHSPSITSRQCVVGYLSLLFNTFNDRIKEFAIQEFLKLITLFMHADEISKFSSEDIAVFLDPNLLIRKAAKDISADDIKITNADRKKASARGTRRGHFGADFVEDEAWAEQVKREKAKKLLESKGETSPEIEEAKAKTAQIVGKIDSANQETLKIVDCLNILSKLRCGRDQNDTLLSKSCHVVIPQMMILLQYPLLSDEVNQCLDRIVFALVDPELKDFSHEISNSLRAISKVNDPKWKSLSDDQVFSKMMEFSRPIVQTVKELHVLASRSTFSISSKCFYTIFPLFRGIFSLKTLLPGCEYAFLIFEKFWADVDPSPTRQLLRYVIETCLIVMSKFRLSPSPDKVFSRVISSTSLTPMEWSPLLGSLGLLNVDSSIRKSCLIGILSSINQGFSDGLNRNPLMVARLFIVRHDADEDVKQLASQVWEKSNMVLPETFMISISPLLQDQENHVAYSAARAVAEGIKNYPHLARESAETLIGIFVEALPEKENQQLQPINKNSLLMKLNPKRVEDSKVSVRASTAIAIESIGHLCALDKSLSTTEELLQYLLAFLLEYGVTDAQIAVRDLMVSAGRALIDNYGDAFCERIIQVLEDTLGQSIRPNEDTAQYDHRHEAAVVLLGAAGKHLNKDDPHLMVILDSLVKALDTPVASVQRAVADCLVSVVQVLKADERMNEYLAMLLKKTSTGESYGDRRGAAYGVSAFVKGLGIPSIKNHDIVNRLKEDCSSGSINSRQGALFVFELLSERLGMLFEPYVITIMPILLKCFSHSSDHVREAAQAAAKTIMTKLSAHGVKQVLTPILSSLPTETAWKSKQEALKLLGTMAFCAPKQLATSLPQIIPGILEASLDGHPKVRESAKIALTDISSVIRNPEISSLSGVLIAALTEPANKTKAALEALLECEFMHSIDAPSLAILIPILSRALKDRGGDLKRKSSIIVGNMCSMINDPKIFIPYLSQVVPGLQEVLLDPIPDVRATSAKALGSLMGGVGEGELSDLIPWLIKTLRSDSSPVERSGAAQGLAEVCLSLPETRIEQILRDTMTLRTHQNSSAREGLLWLLTFLPSVLGEPFAAYISSTLPVVLSGLSDDSEGVREVALRAGQVYVTSHGRAHTQDVIYPLLSGMFDEDWRIRESSISLLGELLYLVGDTKAVGLTDLDNDDDDVAGSSSRVVSTIRAHIGDELANFVLSSLYIVRSDSSSSVRQIALQVWKSIVSNTPKALREIMSKLVDLLIRKLSSQSSDHQIVAGRSLGDLVRKLGDHVLPLVIPYLQQGLRSTDAELRQGVCLGLAEILRAASQKQIETYVDTLVPALQQALCDDSEHVRTLASQAFHALLKVIGNQAIEAVIPSLLERIREEYDESQSIHEHSCLLGLQSIVGQKPRDLLEYLLPILTQHPIRPYASHTLGIVCKAASASIHYHFSTLLPTLMQELILAEASSTTDSAYLSLRSSVGMVIGSTSPQGVNFLVTELGKQIEHESNILYRKWGCLFAADFFRNASIDYSEYIPVMLKYLLSRSADLETDVLESVLEAMNALSSVISIESLSSHMEFIRSCLSLTASDAKHRPGRSDLISSNGSVLLPLFRLPKSLEPFLPIYIHCLMNGSPELREISADGIGELISMTETTQLKPYLIKTTGPLIRVVGDRYPSSVKYAILQTLCILLDKGGIGLKAFVPQLQTTFVKSLSDPAKQVRTKGASALGLLMPMSTRIDPLLNELCQGTQQAESHAIRASFLHAISHVLDSGGEKVGESSTDRIGQVLLNCLTCDDEQVRSSACEVACSIAAILPSTGICDLLFDTLALDALSSSGWAPAAGKAMGCGAVLRSAGDRSLEVRGEVLQFLENGLNDERAPIKVSVCSALSLIVTPPPQSKASIDEHTSLAREVVSKFLSQLTMYARTDSLETRRAAVAALKDFCKYHADYMIQYAAKVATTLCPILSNNDSNIRLKRQAERSMKYLLGITYHSNLTDPHFLSCIQVIQASDPETAKFLKEYSKRMLVKLSEESDDNNW